MQAAANYLPTEEEVRISLNKPTEQLSVDDFMVLYDEYLRAHDVMFSAKSGDFYNKLERALHAGGHNHIVSVAEGEAVPYAVKFELHTNDTHLRITDNSLENGVDDNAADYLGDWRLLASGLNDVTSENGNYLVSGNLRLTEKTV